MGGPRSYRGVGPDVRRRLRREALVETGLDCLQADGLSGVSVRSICARARLTPRYFYENFGDLDDLLVAIVDVVATQVADAALAAIADAPNNLPARVRAAVDAGYGVVADDRRKANALLVAAAGHSALRDRRQLVVVHYAKLALANLSASVPVTALERREAKATALFIMGGAMELAAAVLSGSLRLSRTRVVDHLSALWVGALTG